MSDLEQFLDDTLNLLESNAMVSQHTSESSGAVDGLLKRSHDTAKQTILDKIQQEYVAREKYDELIMAVESVHPTLSRHETALLYIQNAERGNDLTAQAAKGDE